MLSLEGMAFPGSEHFVPDVFPAGSSLRLAHAASVPHPSAFLFLFLSSSTSQFLSFSAPLSLSISPVLSSLSASEVTVSFTLGTCTQAPPARSRQFTISKHKQKYEWLQVAWYAVAAGLAGSERWGRGFWDAKRLAWRSLSVNLHYVNSLLLSRPDGEDTRTYRVIHK